MNQDMNFFSQFKVKKHGDKNYDKYLYIGLIDSVAICVIASIINYGQVFFLNKKIDDYTKKLNDPEFVQLRQESEEVNNKIAALSSYDNDITAVLKAVDSRIVVNTDMLSDIKASNTVTLTSLTISNTEIKIEGFGTSREDIAAFQYNLEQLDYVEDSLVSYINEVTIGSQYTFNINCRLKDVE